jgi:hypothetical protein
MENFGMSNRISHPTTAMGLSSTTSASGTLPRVTVQSLLDEQVSLIGDLSSAINELEMRLQPVTDLPMPEAAGRESSNKRPEPSTIVSVLRDHNDGIHYQMQRLRDLAIRLHV